MINELLETYNELSDISLTCLQHTTGISKVKSVLFDDKEGIKLISVVRVSLDQ